MRTARETASAGRLCARTQPAPELDQSKAEVRKITLATLHEVRSRTRR